jgi:paired amphipathic helix protein Sin3a
LAIGSHAHVATHPSVYSPEARTYGADGQAIEPAVQYVQKIKQRCDPETYRQFLDILSKYHSKPDSIDEVIQSNRFFWATKGLNMLQEEVSKQIARLFKDAPDLRSDFRIFMSDRSQQLLDDPSVFATPSSEGRTKETPDAKGKRKLDFANTSSGVPQKRKRKVIEREREREVVNIRPNSIVNGKVSRAFGIGHLVFQLTIK